MAVGPICRLLLAALALLIPMPANANFGFARDTTGGGNVAAVRPTSIAELKTLLCGSTDSSGDCTDDTPRVIELDRNFDFRGTLGTTSEWGCYTDTCGSNAELGIDRLEYCTGKTSTWITYDNAGVSQQLKMGSNKTLRGIGTSGTIIGTGIKIQRVHNIIIQNVAFVDINAGIVWGGDALSLVGADNVWIDHNYFARVGRQFIRSGSESSTHVTISDNHFDGRSERSAYCDGNHYWNILFNADGDQITFSGNFLHNMSGRGPQFKSGTFHVVNNLFRDFTKGGAIMTTSSTGYLLVEGNYFDNVITPINTGSAVIFAPFWDASDCNAFFGRVCISNDQVNSGTAYRPVDTAALRAFQQHTQYLITPFAANAVTSFVTSFSGTGRI